MPTDVETAQRVGQAFAEAGALEAIVPAFGGFRLVGRIGDLNRVVPLRLEEAPAIAGVNPEVLLELKVHAQIRIEGGDRFPDLIAYPIAGDERREGRGRGQKITVAIADRIEAGTGEPQQTTPHQGRLVA